VAVFQLKQICPPAPDDPIHWTYDRAELIADGVVHAVGVCLGLVGAIGLFMVRLPTAIETYLIAVYAVGLIMTLGMSATYNLWPVSPRKWLLRRFDHSAIYLLIAATYTPFVSQIRDRDFAITFLIVVWTAAVAGAILKLSLPGRFDRLSIGLYLAMGWSGVLAYEKAADALSSSTLILIAAGGALYTLGVCFHSWERLRFQNAIWHGLVLVAAGCHFAAVVGLITA
jgi:hemolysin III